MDGKIEGEGTSGEYRQDKGNELQVGVGQVENSGKYPCGVCREGVDRNSICCTSCKKWTHRSCSRVVGSLVKVAKVGTSSAGTVLGWGEGGGWSKTGCAGSDGGVGGC